MEPNLIVQTSNLQVFKLYFNPPMMLFSVSLWPSDEEEALDWIENEDMKDYHKACWELEFLPVAQKLLETLQPE